MNGRRQGNLIEMRYEYEMALEKGRKDEMEDGEEFIEKGYAFHYVEAVAEQPKRGS